MGFLDIWAGSGPSAPIRTKERRGAGLEPPGLVVRVGLVVVLLGLVLLASGVAAFAGEVVEGAGGDGQPDPHRPGEQRDDVVDAEADEERCGPTHPTQRTHPSKSVPMT